MNEKNKLCAVIVFLIRNYHFRRKACCLYLARGKRAASINESNRLNVFEVKIPIKWSREVVEYDLLRLKIFTRGPQNVRAKHLMVLLILKHKNCLSQTPKKFHLSSPKKVFCIEWFLVSTIVKRKCTSFFLYRKSASFNYTRKWVGFN